MRVISLTGGGATLEMRTGDEAREIQSSYAVSHRFSLWKKPCAVLCMLDVIYGLYIALSCPALIVFFSSASLPDRREKTRKMYKKKKRNTSDE
jgi:hypothetical protein